jgi:O-antigen/teichoic acid export membrane protein
MLTEKLLKMASQLIMLILMARVLAPEALGQLMYCFALASIFLFLNQLGLDTLLVKKFIDQSHKKYSLLTHTLVARLIAGLLAILLVNLLGMTLVSDEYRLMLFVISLYHLFLPFSTFEWFFQSEGRSDLAAVGLISGHIVGFCMRLWCVLTTANLIVLASAFVVEVFVTAMVYCVIVYRQSATIPIRISYQRIRNLTREALPLMISGAVILIYMKVDQLMLGYLSSKEEVAFYVAATRLSEAWYFVGLTLIAVYLPKFLHIKQMVGNEKFESAYIFFGRLLFWLCVAISILTSLLAVFIISSMYGVTYLRSSTVLMVSIWAVPCVVIGSLASRLYIENGRVDVVLRRSLAGLFISLLLNLILIPYYGAVGAAFSLFFTQFFSGVLFPLFDREKSVRRVIFSIIIPFRVGL